MKELFKKSSQSSCVVSCRPTICGFIPVGLLVWRNAGERIPSGERWIALVGCGDRRRQCMWSPGIENPRVSGCERDGLEVSRERERARAAVDSESSSFN